MYIKKTNNENNRNKKKFTVINALLAALKYRQIDINKLHT